ncbi:MAG: glycosyltransferase [Bacteroidota bacterium]
MRILQIIQKPQLRGAEIFACQLSVELIHLGHEVDIVYLFSAENRLADYNLKFYNLGAIQSKRFWDFKAYRKLALMIKEEKYDIVQANASDTLKYAALSKRIYSWKSKLVYRNANKMSAFIKNRLHWTLNRFFLAQADQIISVSENCREDLIYLYSKIKPITFTATIGTYNSDQVEAKSFNNANPVWVHVGSFVLEKNHTFLIDLFGQFVKKHAEAELWLLGDGPLRPQIERYVSELGLIKKVIFYGYQNEVIPILKAASIMVMPSKIEGLPGVILEALSCGIPVVASDVGGISEVIKNGQTGYVISTNQPEDYLDKIDELLSNGNTYEMFSENGKNLIQNHFLMTGVAKRFEHLYKNIPGKKGAK